MNNMKHTNNIMSFVKGFDDSLFPITFKTMNDDLNKTNCKCKHITNITLISSDKYKRRRNIDVNELPA